MILCKLLNFVEINGCYLNNKAVKKCDLKINVSALSLNSKTVKKNGLFFAINGTSLNGESYIKDAVLHGARVVVAEKKCNLPTGIVLCVVKNVRKAMAQISANFYEQAHKKLKIIGITGTNGKSSCAYIVHEILSKLNSENYKCGLIGTNSVFIGNKKIKATLTTPDPILLHEIFYKMVKNGVKVCVMEVSSHSIFFDKIYGIKFECLALTNVKTDHLDFFKTQTNYEQTKLKLFLNYKAKNLVLNGASALTPQIIKNTKNLGRIFVYEKIKNSNKNEVLKNIQKINYKIVKQTLNGCEFLLFYNNKKYNILSNFFGEEYVQNLSLCIGVFSSLKIPLNYVLKHLKMLHTPGRINVIKYSKKINFILDYAHTLSSTKMVLNYVKKLSGNKNIIVVGAPGNRDEFKRKQIAKICAKFGSVILCADNPKYENPYKIMEEMKKGAKGALVIENRTIAIVYALKMASKQKTGANIIVLGKGIENYQDYNNNQIPYSDFNTIKNLVKQKK